MPLAFDLSSTLARGSILPVATTDRAMSPFSTLARLGGSISRLRGRGGDREAGAPVAQPPAAHPHERLPQGRHAPFAAVCEAAARPVVGFEVAALGNAACDQRGGCAGGEDGPG